MYYTYVYVYLFFLKLLQKKKVKRDLTIRIEDIGTEFLIHTQTLIKGLYNYNEIKVGELLHFCVDPLIYVYVCKRNRFKKDENILWRM